MINSSKVRDMCGGVSDMSLWRWLAHPDMNFPKPIVIQRRRYWHKHEVAAWIEAQRRTGESA